MKSKLLTALVIAVTTIFLSTQALAWGGSKKTDKDIGNTNQNQSSKSNQGSSSSPSDRDMGKDQGRLNSSNSTGQYETNPWKVGPTP